MGEQKVEEHLCTVLSCIHAGMEHLMTAARTLFIQFITVYGCIICTMHVLAGKLIKMASVVLWMSASEEMKTLLQENPKFNQLLEKLQDLMGADGTQPNLVEDLDKVSADGSLRIITVCVEAPNACPLQANNDLHLSRRSCLVQQALHDSVVVAVKEGCLESDETRKRGFALFKRSMEVAHGLQCLQLNPTQNTLGLQARHLQSVDQLQGSKDKVLEASSSAMLRPCHQDVKVAGSFCLFVCLPLSHLKQAIPAGYNH